jgi:minimal PKS acyl carrier protein
VNTFTLDELHTIMGALADEADVGDPGAGADLADTCYADLGYDSLARLEIVARIRQSVAVAVPDEAVDAGSTPATTVAAVNVLLGTTEAALP